ncbi:MFS transporter [Pseudonocardia cypriaca]|uniref:DHA1 family inner membrane transport protein n=1 Tax=Pseudonocardia cypriaca TaxID=882449 RepID=A0A543FV70_9PSEU|nr:MFS transporter [Pseudonocardia cypriaca]TQM37740.1 DHA1 family inner membrane transport protein [Pseudonocardia cypriaca]
MSNQQAVMSGGRANLVLATLFLGMFVLGTAELLVVGVLNVIAADLQVSIPAAGASVTGYALGLAIGGPLLAALTIRLDKRLVLAGALLLFILANLVTVLTASYGLFLTARVGTGAFQGLFIAAAFGVGISVVPPERMGRAISVVVSGVTVSAALGVPLGTLAGQLLGWRGSFVAIVVVSVVALIATLAVVPSVPSSGGGAGSQAKYAFAPRVLAVLVLHVLVFAAIYTALTYIVPFLETVTGVSGPWISVFLLAYGVATAVGSMSGGRFADRSAARTLIVGSIGVTAALAVLHLMGAVALLAAVAVLAMGLFGMGMAPSLQYRVVSLAGPGGALAQSLPASAVNVGIAFGSFAGGVAIERSTASSVVLPGLVIAVIAVAVAWATRNLTPPVVEADSAQPSLTDDMQV